MSWPHQSRCVCLDLIRSVGCLSEAVLVIVAGGGGIRPASRGSMVATCMVSDAVIDQGPLQRIAGARLGCRLSDHRIHRCWRQSTSIGVSLVNAPSSKVTPQALARHTFPAGSIAPKVEAASEFVLATGKKAHIGSKSDRRNACRSCWHRDLSGRCRFAVMPIVKGLVYGCVVSGTANSVSSNQVQLGCAQDGYNDNGKDMSMTASIPQLTNMENKAHLSNLGTVVAVRGSVVDI